MGSTLTAFERTVLAGLSARAGVAGRVLGAWSEHLSSAIQTAQSLTALAQLGVTEEAAVADVLRTAAAAGLIRPSALGFLPGNQSAEVFKRLALALNAIAHYRDVVHQDSTLARVVLTKPPRPCALENELQQLGWRTFDIDPTERAFKRMVQGATERVVVMTPFFDNVGAKWLQELFEDLKSSVLKVLVLRSLEKPGSSDYPHIYDTLRPWLAQRGVHVYNYSIPRTGGHGRETFHAKVVLCDLRAAYVGSSNINGASLEHSMEMGVELIGKAALDVSVVVQAVLASSTRHL